MAKKKLSIKEKALKANGLNRSCKDCNHSPCPQSIAYLCRDAFVNGYEKGYQQAKKEQNEREQYETLYDYKKQEGGKKCVK